MSYGDIDSDLAFKGAKEDERQLAKKIKFKAATRCIEELMNWLLVCS